MTRRKTKTRIAWLVAIVALVTFTGIALAVEAPSGYLMVPGHHGGVVGDNDIPVTATALEAGYDYVIKLDVAYHSNPRTPPEYEGYCEGLGGYEEWSVPFSGDPGEVTLTFTVPLPDCHCQITAGFTLLYKDWQGGWAWNGDERATEVVDIWSGCRGQGCTPGFWKNHLEDWGPTGYLTTDDFDTTFGVDLFDPDITLGEAINAKGGGVKKLARHGTAALLSAAHPDVGYPLSVAEVKAAVQAGDADTLAAYNELGCPID